MNWIIIVLIVIFITAAVIHKLKRKGVKFDFKKGDVPTDWNKHGGNIAVWFIIPTIIACVAFIVPGLIVEIFSDIELILGFLVLLACIGLYTLSRKAWFLNSMKGIAWAYGIGAVVVLLTLVFRGLDASGTEDQDTKTTKEDTYTASYSDSPYPGYKKFDDFWIPIGKKDDDNWSEEFTGYWPHDYRFHYVDENGKRAKVWIEESDGQTETIWDNDNFYEFKGPYLRWKSKGSERVKVIVYIKK